jgi:hypothetical protein
LHAFNHFKIGILPPYSTVKDNAMKSFFILIFLMAAMITHAQTGMATRVSDSSVLKPDTLSRLPIFPPHYGISLGILLQNGFQSTYSVGFAAQAGFTLASNWYIGIFYGTHAGQSVQISSLKGIITPDTALPQNSSLRAESDIWYLMGEIGYANIRIGRASVRPALGFGISRYSEFVQIPLIIQTVDKKYSQFTVSPSLQCSIPFDKYFSAMAHIRYNAVMGDESNDRSAFILGAGLLVLF